MSFRNYRSSLLLILVGLLICLASCTPASEVVVSGSSGTLVGAFGVNSIGAAAYTIDLQLPPGTQEIAPALSVIYNSQAAEGILGLGFSLSGLSSIQRCGATLPLDGYIGAVSFNADDRFCLDNSRLILISGSAYGDPDTVYHTEQESWTDVVAQGTCGTGPCSFLATNKDGWTLALGSDPASRLTVPGQSEVIAWQVDRITDLNGNTVEVVYTADTDTLQNHPTLLRYTSNPTNGLEARRMVFLDYEERPDIVPKYQGGARFVQNRRLATIRTEVDDEAILRYSFSYSQSTGSGRSLLSAVQISSDRDGTSLSPTTFTWQTGVEAVSSPNGTSTGEIARDWCSGSSASLDFGDFNGDGRADLLCTSGGEAYVLLATADGAVPPNNRADGQLTLPSDWCDGSDAALGWADFNADQLLDLTCAEDGETFRVLLSTGADLESPNNQATGELSVPSGWCADGEAGWLNFNGDGTADLACRLDGGEQRVLVSDGTEVSSPNSSAVGTVATGYCAGGDGFWSDLNGDGMADLFCREDGTFSALISTGSQLESPNTNAAGVLTTGWCTSADAVVQATDFNGDGLQDLSCAATDGRLALLLSTGSLLSSPNTQADGSLVSDWCTGSNSFVDWGDFNGDGLSDAFCHASDGSQLVLISTGEELTSPVSQADGRIASDWCVGARGSTIDFNGDALADLSCFDAEAGNIAVLIHDAPFPDLLSGVTNGLGGGFEVTYLPMTDDAVSAPGSAVEYPMLDVRTPIYLVSAYTETDGQGSEYRYAYFYTGARTEIERRQWLGFEKIRHTTLADGRYTETVYIQDYPVVQFTASSEAFSPQGERLASVAYTPVVTSPYPDVQQVLTETETQSTYTAGTPDFVLETEYAYDTYGNTVSTFDYGDADDPGDDVFDCWKYANETDEAWRIGYRVEHKTTSSAAACEAFLDSDVSTWSPDTDLRWDTTAYDERMNPTALSVWDDINASWLVQTRSYDAFGNAVTLSDWAGNLTEQTFDSTYRTFVVSLRSPPLEGGQVLEQSFAYDPAFGIPTEQTDVNGNQRETVLDGLGRLSETWGPDPQGSTGAANQKLSEVIYGADGAGNYVEVRERPTWSDDDSATWPMSRVYVDGLARPTETLKSGPVGGGSVVTEQRYNELRLPSQVSLPRFEGEAASWVETQYDTSDRQTRVTQPDGTIRTYEYLRGELEVLSTMAPGSADERQTLTTHSIRQVAQKTTGSNGGWVAYSYDPAVQLTEVLDTNGATTTSTFDSVGRVVASSSTDTGTKTMTYGSDGLLASIVDAVGNRTVLSYDALGRVTLKITSGSDGTTESIRYAYDESQYTNGLGQLTSVVADTGSYAFSYDRYGELAGESLTYDGATYVQLTEYTPQGEISRLVYPDGDELSTSYDAQGNIVQAILTVDGTPVTVAEYSAYNALDQPAAVLYGNGVSVGFSYFTYAQSMGRLASVEAEAPAGAAVLYRADYGWNSVGQVASRFESWDDGGTVHDLTLTYDSMGYLSQASGASGVFEYAYDLAGNITQKDGVDYSYKANTNQLVAGSNDLAATYDGNGNMTTLAWPEANWTYLYDVEARLSQIEKDGEVVEQASYDFAGRRLRRSDDNGIRSIYVSAEYDITQSGDEEFHTKYVFGSSGRLAAVTEVIATEAQQTAMRGVSARLGVRLFDSGSLAGCRSLGAQWFEVARYAALDASWMRRLAPAGSLLLALALFTLGCWWSHRRSKGRGSGLRPVLSVRGCVVWLVIVSLMAPLQTARAELGPGAGYPEPGLLYFLGDLTSDTALVTDETGARTSLVSYLPFGTIDETTSEGPDDFRPKFGGHELDAGSGLYFFGSRYYHPVLGRFIQPDPALQYASPYVYVGNDPLTVSDPDGEVAVLAVVGAMAAVGAVAGAYAGGAAVSHQANPAYWDWGSGDTFAGIFAGALLGAAGGAAGGAASTAGVAVGIAGEIAVGAIEGAAFAALGGGSASEIATSAATGGVAGGVGAAAGAAVGRAGSAARRSAGRGGSGLAEEAASAASAGATVTSTRSAVRVGASEARFGSRTLRQAESGAAGRRSLSTSEFDDFGGSDLACPAFSFVAGTEVLTPGGMVPIEALRPGDEVLGRDENGVVSAHAVLASFHREAPSLVALSTPGDETLATPEHPFWVPQRGWVEAGALRVGDLLVNDAGGAVPVTAVDQIAGPVWVYNIEVARVHDYFVGEDQVLTHNARAGAAKRCSARLAAMGRTPSKASATGRKVQTRMEREGLIRTDGRVREVQVKTREGGPKVWKPIDRKIHMGHTIDAVTWWNHTGYRYGAKSPQVRSFMLDPKHYELEWGSLNSSNGAKLRQVYRRPLYWGQGNKWPP